MINVEYSAAAIKTPCNERCRDVYPYTGSAPHPGIIAGNFIPDKSDISIGTWVCDQCGSGLMSKHEIDLKMGSITMKSTGFADAIKVLRKHGKSLQIAVNILESHLKETMER